LPFPVPPMPAESLALCSLYFFSGRRSLRRPSPFDFLPLRALPLPPFLIAQTFVIRMGRFPWLGSFPYTRLPATLPILAVPSFTPSSDFASPLEELLVGFLSRSVSSPMAFPIACVRSLSSFLDFSASFFYQALL